MAGFCIFLRNMSSLVQIIKGPRLFFYLRGSGVLGKSDVSKGGGFHNLTVADVGEGGGQNFQILADVICVCSLNVIPSSRASMQKF